MSVKTFFFFFFFGEHLILGGKNLGSSELFEKFRLNFRTNRLKLIQDQCKFESRSFAHFSLFQNNPPFSKSWIRACVHVLLQLVIFITKKKIQGKFSSGFLFTVNIFVEWILVTVNIARGNILGFPLLAPNHS